MNSPAKAFAPGNVSCIFKIHQDPDPAKKGSLGVGFTVDKGVTIKAKLSAKTEIFFNDKKINFPTVESVIKKLIKDPTTHITINCFSELPLGSGFGLSGASALASAYAINKLLKLKYSNLALAKIAHLAEVENKTGLGDVVNQYFGGFLLKEKPSSSFKVINIPFGEIPVYCKFYGTLSTKKIISDPKLLDSINKAASNSLSEIKILLKNYPKSKIKFSDLIKISKSFSLDSGLLKNKKLINQINTIEKSGGHASMIMLGNAIFSDIPFARSIKLKISNSPAILL